MPIAHIAFGTVPFVIYWTSRIMVVMLPPPMPNRSDVGGREIKRTVSSRLNDIMFDILNKLLERILCRLIS